MGDEINNAPPPEGETKSGEGGLTTPNVETPPPPTQPPPKDPPAAEPTAAENLITKANAAALRQEEANKQLSTLLDRQEAMQVEKTLGGEAEAGSKQMTEEQKIDAEAKKLLAGTGFEKSLFPNEADGIKK